jgi:hypothetical protein
MGTTPIYGFPYPDPSDLVANYPALGQELAEDIEAVLPTIGGSVLINATSIANSGGTATKSSTGAVTASGVTSVSINGCFSATYDVYLMQINNLLGSTGGDGVIFRMRAAGTDNSATEYNRLGREMGGADTNVNQGSQTSFNIGTLSSTSTTGCAATIYQPFLAQRTASTYLGVRHNVSVVGGGSLANNASYDGLTILATAGTLSGIIRIYGYRN